MCLHDSTPYFILTEQARGRTWFARVQDYELVKTEISTDICGELHTADGVHFEVYGAYATGPPTDFMGGDLVVWRSEDAGQTWDEGQTIVDRRAMGRGLHSTVNLVRNYRGDGPLVLFQLHSTEQKDPRPALGTAPGFANYFQPYRWNGRLYMLDADHRYVTGSSTDARS